MEQIDHAAVVFLLEFVHRAAKQKMQVKLAAERTQLAAGATIQNCFGDTQRAAKARDNPSDRGDFHLPCRVAHQIDRT